MQLKPPPRPPVQRHITRTSWELSEKGLNSSKPLWLAFVSCVTEGSCKETESKDRSAAVTGHHQLVHHPLCLPVIPLLAGIGMG